VPVRHTVAIPMFIRYLPMSQVLLGSELILRSPLVQSLAQSMQMEFLSVQNTIFAEDALQQFGWNLVPDVPGIQTARDRRIRCAFNDRSAIRK
jgi:hypothetical protein